MIARIRKGLAESEEGFTLIELLVVIIIIGILAAIAIPLFLNQRKGAYDATAKSDLNNLAIAEETTLNQTGSYTTSIPTLYANGMTWSADGGLVTGTGDSATLASKADLEVYSATGAEVTGGGTAIGGFCAVAAPPSGNTWVYESWNGGLQPINAATACPSSFTPPSAG